MILYKLKINLYGLVSGILTFSFSSVDRMKHEAQTESKCGIAVDNDSEKAAAAIAGRWLLLVKIKSFFFKFQSTK